MSTQDWQVRLREVYDRGLAAWQQGRRSAKTLFNPEDTDFLASIGCTPQELFDFIEDWFNYGEPGFDTVLALQAIRHDHFLTVMGGKPSRRVVSMQHLPAKSAEVDGIAWLPRILVKARLKLRGEMPEDLMYGCAGDRRFLRSMNLTVGQFLELVRRHGEDDRQIIRAVKESAGLGGS